MREFDLLKHVYEQNVALGSDVIIPPGDDMAMVRVGAESVLIAVDQLVAGQHVALDRVPLHLVGRKAVTRCLSDIAAMAAQPVASLAAVTLPPDFGEKPANALFDAMRETAARYHCPLIGGDVAFHREPSHPLVCTVTVLAMPGPTAPITRGGAKVGDAIYVTGELGGSYQPDGLGHHLTFVPRIDEAMELAAMLDERLHAMIDLSDGLGRDASHIAEQSGVRIAIDAVLVPCRDGLDWRRAMGDGEDYELCFTASGDVPASIGGVVITKVGEVVAASAASEPKLIVRDGEHVYDGSELGWEHRG